MALHITIVNGEPSFVINDPDLRHESSRSWTFGLDHGVQYYTLRVRVSAGLFTTRIDEDRLENTPDFWKVDLTARQKFPFGGRGGITLGLTLENAFNQFQKDLDLGASRDAGYIYGPRFPRSLRFSCTYDF